MSEAASYWAIVPAAGVGRRMGGSRPKQYLPLRGKSVIEHSIDRLLALSRIRSVLVAINPDDEIWNTLDIAGDPRVETIRGGAERNLSVLNALENLQNRAADQDWVLVHDAVRPCVTAEAIHQLMEALADHPTGGLLGHPLSDTLKFVDDSGHVQRTVDRTNIWAAGTPQMFRYGVLMRAMRAQAAGGVPTDEAMAVEALGLHPRMISGRRDNLKITVPGDLELADLILRSQTREKC